MRRLFAFAGLAVLVSIAPAQPPAEVKVEARYGIPGNPRLFPQTEPKTVLASAIKAAEAGRYDYLVAHLMDEKFIEGRIDNRAKLIEPTADAELRALRDRQRKDVTLDKRLQLPDDPNLFNEAVKAEARLRAFKQVLRDVEAKLTEDPTSLRELRRFLREGELVSSSAEAARITLKDVKDRQVFLKKVGERWFIENRQQDEEKEK
jgi:hypothetical protein